MNWSLSVAVALRLGRVSNLPTVWTNVLVGIVLAGGSVFVLATLPILMALSLFYTGGMFLNDAFDAEIDAQERPERPIPSAQVSRSLVFVLGFGMLLLGLLMLAWIGFVAGTGSRPIYSGIVLAALIVLYNTKHKQNPLSPLIMGMCRLLIYITAGTCITVSLPAALWLGSGLLLCYLIGLTYVAKQENLGRVKALWPLVFLLAPVLYGVVVMSTMAWSDMLGVVPYWLVLVSWIVWALWLIRRRGPGDIPAAVVSLIAGIALVDAMFLAAFAQPGLALLALLGFSLTLVLQRYVAGT